MIVSYNTYCCSRGDSSVVQPVISGFDVPDDPSADSSAVCARSGAKEEDRQVRTAKTRSSRCRSFYRVRRTVTSKIKTMPTIENSVLAGERGSILSRRGSARSASAREISGARERACDGRRDNERNIIIVVAVVVVVTTTVLPQAASAACVRWTCTAVAVALVTEPDR